MGVQDIRYRRLGYVALTVTDPAQSLKFYRDIVGVDAFESGDDAIFLRCSDRHHDLQLVRGDVPALKRIGWEMESPEALAALRDHMASRGIAMVAVSKAEADTLGISEAFRMTEPTTGATFEFYAAMEKAAEPFTPSHTNITRLGHVVLHSPRKTETEAFLVDDLNFRISDRVGPIVTFMRCFPNPLHHSFGVGHGAAATLGHINFMVTDVDDIGRANNRMKRNEVPIVFGPGRHPTSDSIFFYFLDPDGITVEYSFGMEEFPEHDAREPRLFPLAPESLDTWGGMPEGKFSKVGVIEALES